MSDDLSILEQTLAALEGGRRLLERLDDEQYAAPAQPFSAYGAGDHFRHCLEYFECFLANARVGRVDYDLRERNERLSRDRRQAMRSIESIQRRLRSMQELDPATALMVRMDASEDEARDDAGWSASTLHRELRFLHSHTIHHYALIAWCARVQGVQPDEEFGVAPSTLRYWRSVGICAPSPGSAE